MNLRSQFHRSALVVLAGIAAAACSPAPDTSGDTTPTIIRRMPSEPALTEKAFGPLTIGMSVADAGRALGTPIGLPADKVAAQRCRMVSWQGVPPGVQAMIEEGVVVRVDVDASGVSTADNVYVGDSEAQVAAAYPGRVETMPHKYVAGGHYLVVRPTAPRDSAYRLIFETDGKQVTRFRGGQRPQVEYVEHCG